MKCLSLVGALLASSVVVAQEYEFIALPFTGGTSSGAYDINNGNVVVGKAGLSNGYAPFRWTLAGGMQMLEKPIGIDYAEALSINDAGYIAGHALINGGTTGIAIGWRPDGSVVSFAALTTNSTVAGITENNLIFGRDYEGYNSCIFGTVDAPALSNVNAGALNSCQGNTLLGTGTQSSAWTSGPEGTRDLTMPSGFTGASARGMSTDGIVVGSASFFQYPSTRTRAFWWDASGAAHALPSFPGGSNARAMDRNTDGVVVGYGTGTGSGGVGCSAFVYENGSLVNAESMVDLPAGIEICDIVAINENGWMVGRHYDYSQLYSGAFVAFVLRPVQDDEPDCPADFNGSDMVDGADLALLLGYWGQAGPTDLNDDGITSGADLTVLLGAWGNCP